MDPGGGVDSGRGGLPTWTPRWIPAGLRSPRYPPLSPPAKLLLLSGYFRLRGWTPRGVASQKIGPVAGEIARHARQHTFQPEKEPQNNGLAVFLSRVRSPFDQKKPSLNPFRRTFFRSTGHRLPGVERSPLSCHRVPFWIPTWTPGGPRNPVVSCCPVAHAWCEHIPFVGLGAGLVNPSKCLPENSVTG